MNNRSHNDYVVYKLMRAKDTFEDVQILVEREKYYSAANRLYYACFYAVSALLIKNEIYAKKHSGVKQMFSLHFITTGIIKESYGKLYAELFDMRQTGDYDDNVYFEKEDIVPLLAPAMDLVTQIEQLLSKQ